MKDPYDTHSHGLESPVTRAQSIVPNDADDIAIASRALNMAQAGIVWVTTMTGMVADIYIASGIPFPIRVTRIWATGTTATDIVALS